MTTHRLLLSSCLALAGCFLTGCFDTHVAAVDGASDRDANLLEDAGLRDGGRDTGPRRDGGPDEDAWVPPVDAWVPPVDAWMEPVDAWVPPPDAWVNPCPACDDHDACNGIEGCDPTTGECFAGTPLECNDGLACNTDSCDPTIGCMHTSPDSDGDGDNDCTDCAPTNPGVFHGATEVCNSVDDNCNGATDEGVGSAVWADCDGDGWATETAVSFDSCPVPPVSDTGCGTPTQAWTTRRADSSDFDCADDDVRAHSTTTAFQSIGIATAFPEVDFDFNCDLDEEQQFPATGSCVAGPAGCVTTPGWQTTVPDCGTSGVFIAGCTVACIPSTEARTQACR